MQNHRHRSLSIILILLILLATFNWPARVIVHATDATPTETTTEPAAPTADFTLAAKNADGQAVTSTDELAGESTVTLTGTLKVTTEKDADAVTIVLPSITGGQYKTVKVLQNNHEVVAKSFDGNNEKEIKLNSDKLAAGATTVEVQATLQLPKSVDKQQKLAVEWQAKGFDQEFNTNQLTLTVAPADEKETTETSSSNGDDQEKTPTSDEKKTTDDNETTTKRDLERADSDFIVTKMNQQDVNYAATASHPAIVQTVKYLQTTNTLSGTVTTNLKTITATVNGTPVAIQADAGKWSLTLTPDQLSTTDYNSVLLRTVDNSGNQRQIALSGPVGMITLVDKSENMRFNSISLGSSSKLAGRMQSTPILGSNNTWNLSVVSNNAQGLNWQLAVASTPFVDSSTGRTLDATPVYLQTDTFATLTTTPQVVETHTVVSDKETYVLTNSSEKGNWDKNYRGVDLLIYPDNYSGTYTGTVTYNLIVGA
ncbi:hypothetical protein ACRYI5_05775 [Furfurilactobacillus sp. WILCCON 0119]